MSEEQQVNTEVQTEVQAPNLMDSISEDYKSLVETKGFKGVDDVLKSYQNLERMVGNSIRLPNEDSSPEFKTLF